jgi:hypothetical protein
MSRATVPQRSEISPQTAENPAQADLRSLVILLKIEFFQ